MARITRVSDEEVARGCPGSQGSQSVTPRPRSCRASAAKAPSTPAPATTTSPTPASVLGDAVGQLVAVGGALAAGEVPGQHVARALDAPHDPVGVMAGSELLLHGRGDLLPEAGAALLVDPAVPDDGEAARERSDVDQDAVALGGAGHAQ